MSRRTAASWLAWSLAGLSVAMFLASVVLTIMSLYGAPATRSPSTWGTGGLIGGLVIFLPFLAFPLVGALIASKRPQNPIGWICLADGLLWMLSGVTESYSAYGVAKPGSVPFPVAIYALGEWLWVPTVGLLGIYLILLFPDGRLPSRRWRPLAWLSGVVILLLSVGIALAPGPVEALGGVRNPFGLERAPWVGYAAVVLPLLPVCVLASASSLVLRYRRSGGEERQQIKWLAFAASFLGLVALITVASTLMFAPESLETAGTQPLWLELLQDVELLSLAGVPVAVGFAILRHRLYDIDVVINRTLVYGFLTAMLVAVYVGSVVVLQYIFRALSGGESQLAIVASTLAIAALFNPLRRRVQGFVDRRFYRRKYDATKTLEAFSAKLRDETDLDALNAELVGVVRETMQPTHVSLWLRPDTAPNRERLTE
jgi:NADH:ubiquinone oxidoreductase subunit 6 (subunit J)